jgi:UDP-N-acetylmuramate dehydrogenase
MINNLFKLISDIQCPDKVLICYTTFSIGGPAEFLLIPPDREALIRSLEILTEAEKSFRILGGGSNLLVDDRGVEGVVIKPGWRPEDLVIRAHRVEAPAGMELSRLVKAAGSAGRAGLEFAAGIPGTVGGAVFMNAGWGGEELAGVIRKVWVYRPGYGVAELDRKKCRFGYRASRFQESGEVILKVELELRPGDRGEIAARTWEVLRQRKESLPLEYPSAGSVFKNPAGDYAGRLIEAAGLKGKRIGDAEISRKHANVIVNLGSARFREVKELIEIARGKIQEDCGVRLELEIIIWESI